MSVNLLALSILFGFILGGLTALFFKSLEFIQALHIQRSELIYGLPFFIVGLFFLKRNTLFFPAKVQDVIETDEVTYKFWNPLGVVYHYIGALGGHFFGASVGREGVVLVLSAQLSRIFNQSFDYFKPIALGSGFAVAMGIPWIGLVFSYDILKTNWTQKIYIFIVSWVGCLVLQTFQIPHLLPLQSIQIQTGFWDKLSFVVFFGLALGFLSRYSKLFSTQTKEILQGKSWIFPALVAVVLTVILAQPFGESMKSLSLFEFQKILNFEVSLNWLLMKWFLTLCFVSIGFMGGDFVPTVVVGSGLGVVVAQYFKVPLEFGLMLGSFGLFYGTHLLKWTAFFLTVHFFGWGEFLWVYFFLTVMGWSCGSDSFYFSKQKQKNLFTFVKRF